MFYQSELTKKAFNIVNKEFNGVVDKGGRPYIGHLTRVASGIDIYCNQLIYKLREKLTIVALLHDLIEDTDWTKEDLLKEFDGDIVEAVMSITKVGGESYEDYINRVINNPLAIRVKLSDLKDNMDITRLPELGDKEIKRLKKYHKTYNMLLKEIN